VAEEEIIKSNKKEEKNFQKKAQDMWITGQLVYEKIISIDTA